MAANNNPINDPIVNILFDNEPKFHTNELLGDNVDFISADQRCNTVQLSIVAEDEDVGDSVQLSWPPGPELANWFERGFNWWTATHQEVLQNPIPGTHSLTFLIISKNYMSNDPSGTKYATYIEEFSPTVVIMPQRPDQSGVIVELFRKHTQLKSFKLRGEHDFKLLIYYNNNKVTLDDEFGLNLLGQREARTTFRRVLLVSDDED